MKDFIFLGGDLRFIYAAARLNKHYNCGICKVYGFDMLHDDVCDETGVTILKSLDGRRFSNVILPLPMSRNCDYITAPYYSGKMSISSVMDVVDEDSTIYCGKACPCLEKMCRKKSLTLIDYFEREELTVLNAAVTAEGAIEIIMREKARAIMDMKILITGYGRISKILSQQLHALGADVTVCARKYSDLAWARIMGCSAVHIDDIDSILGGFDTIVNTIPAQVFDSGRLARLKSDCLIVDLASKTGIEDLELAKNAGVKVIWALSLPGKVAPITAWEIVADTILNIISEIG